MSSSTAPLPDRPVGRPMPPDAELGDAPEARLGLAVVGIGKYALEQIVPRLARTRHVRLAALVSGDREKGLAVARAYGLSPRAVYDYDAWERLADDASVEGVYVITPPALHAELTVRAAEAGKHVLCEKPMAASSAECERMIDACARAERRLMIGYRVHWEPYNVEALRLIRAGELGTVRQFVGQHGGPVDPHTPHGAWRLQRTLGGGGSLWDIGIYSLHAARWFTGEEPVEVRATIRRPPGELVDGVRADVELGLDWSARFPSGVVATATSAYDHEINRLHVLGEDASLELAPATSYAGIQLRVQSKEGVRQVKLAQESESQFTGMLDEFALAVRERREPRTGGREGLRDIRIMEAIYTAAETARAVEVASS